MPQNSHYWSLFEQNFTAIEKPCLAHREERGSFLLLRQENKIDIRRRGRLLSRPHSRQNHSVHLIVVLLGQIQSHLPFAPGDSSSDRKYLESLRAETRRLSGNRVPLIPFLLCPRKRKETQAKTPPGASQPVKYEEERKGKKF